MAKCRDCGEEIIFVRRNGKLVPCDPTPPLHFRNRKHIEATRKKHKPKPKPVNKEAVELVVKAVGWPQKDAVAFVREHAGLSDAELLTAALAVQAEAMKQRGDLR